METKNNKALLLSGAVLFFVIGGVGQVGATEGTHFVELSNKANLIIESAGEVKEQRSMNKEGVVHGLNDVNVSNKIKAGNSSNLCNNNWNDDGFKTLEDDDDEGDDYNPTIREEAPGIYELFYTGENYDDINDALGTDWVVSKLTTPGTVGDRKFKDVDNKGASGLSQKNAEEPKADGDERKKTVNAEERKLDNDYINDLKNEDEVRNEPFEEYKTPDDDLNERGENKKRQTVLQLGKDDKLAEEITFGRGAQVGTVGNEKVIKVCSEMLEDEGVKDKLGDLSVRDIKAKVLYDEASKVTTPRFDDERYKKELTDKIYKKWNGISDETTPIAPSWYTKAKSALQNVVQKVLSGIKSGWSKVKSFFEWK